MKSSRTKNETTANQEWDKSPSIAARSNRLNPDPEEKKRRDVNRMSCDDSSSHSYVTASPVQSPLCGAADNLKMN
jgi:hypothetical protein